MLRAFLAALLLQTLPASGKEPGETWKVETFERRFEPGDATELRLANFFGELRVHGTDEPEIAVYAAFQHHAADPRRPDLEVETDTRRFELVVVYPESPTPAPDAWRKRRIDLTVYLPRKLPLHAETLHERLRIEDHAAAIEAFSQSGDVEVVASARVNARSHHGKIWSRASGESLEPQTLATTSGEIRLDVPWSATFHATIETRGEIASDYSIEIDWLSGRQKKRGTVAGTGQGPAVRIESENGNVRLLRQIPPPGPGSRRPDGGPRGRPRRR